jgi:hypothetical protein
MIVVIKHTKQQQLIPVVLALIGEVPEIPLKLYGVSGNEVYSFSDTVDDYHDRVIAMHLRKFNNKVDTDDIPLTSGVSEG